MLGCGSDGRASGQVAFEPIVGPPEVPFLALTGRSGIRESREIVIRDAGSWEAFWTEHTSLFGHPLALPAVDFAEEMVVGIVHGDGRGGAVTVTRIRTADDALTVSFEWRIRGACPGRFFVPESPQPSALVRLRRIDRPVGFEESVRVQNCD